ncbi:MAG: hypothetical protein ACRDOI_06375 [Trebonia sp.]
MAIEISVESYQFTCARCAARWTESYQVSQEIDDAGAIRSFYRRHGGPCEAPVSGNVECPNCHASKALRDPLYGVPPDFDPVEAGRALAVPPPRAVEAPPGPARHAAAHTWRRFKFSAVVTLEAAGRPGRQYLSGVPGLMVRAPSCQRPTQRHYFPAVVYTDDERPLRPGDRGVLVTISVPDDDASGYFQSGQRFAVWDGADIGHGTVAQRLFFQWR